MKKPVVKPGDKVTFMGVLGIETLTVRRLVKAGVKVSRNSVDEFTVRWNYIREVTPE